jgi:hypothetical protein
MKFLDPFKKDTTNISHRWNIDETWVGSSAKPKVKQQSKQYGRVLFLYYQRRKNQSCL